MSLARLARRRHRRKLEAAIIPEYHVPSGAVQLRRSERRVYKYEKAIEEDRLPTHVEIGRELDETATELEQDRYPEVTIRYASLRKLKLRRLGYVHTAVVYGNAFHDGRIHRKRIEVFSKYPLRHLHHAFIYETFTPPWAIEDKGKQATYHESYRKSGMPIPEYRGMPRYNYNIFTWRQVRDGKFAVSEDTVTAQWTEYEQKS